MKNSTETSTNKLYSFAAILLLFSLVFYGCLSPYSGPADSSGVIVVGDSLTNEATNEMNFFYSLDSGVKASINGADGLTSCFGRHNIQLAVDLNPAVLVIALGTNDVALGWDIEDFLCVTDILLNITPGVDVLWIIPLYGADQIRSTIEYWKNEAPHVKMAGWDEVTLYPAYYRADGIHHNSKGRVAYAEFIVQSSMALIN